MSLQINIPTTSTTTSPSGNTNSNSTKPYTVYNITIEHPLRTVTVPKRYSDFVALHNALIAEVNGNSNGKKGDSCDADSDKVSILSNRSKNVNSTANKVITPRSLPPKSWITRTVGNPALTERRRAGLEEYLRAIETGSDARWRRCTAWRTFLDLPGSYRPASAGNESSGDRKEVVSGGNGGGDVFGAGSSGIGGMRGMLTNLTTQAGSPTGWLDVHAELKSQLQAARSALARREQLQNSSSSSPSSSSSSSSSSLSSSLSSTTSQSTITQETANVHEIAGTAKKSLVRAGTLVAALDAGLHRLSGPVDARDKNSSSGRASNNKNRSNGTRILGPGELRRRRDMLCAARTERAGLEALLHSSSNSNTNTNAASATNANSNNNTHTRPQYRSSTTKTLLDTSATTSTNANTTTTTNNNNNRKPRLQRTLGGGSQQSTTTITTPKETAQTRPLDNTALLQLQQETMDAQDKDVNLLTASVRKIKDMGQMIGEEVALQTEMMGLVQADVERVEGKVGVARGRVKKLK